MSIAHAISHSFNVTLAVKYGPLQAVLIQHFQYWISHNKRLKRNFHEGRYWSYQTQEEIIAHFPYFSRQNLRTLINNLVDAGVLIVGNFNKKKFDKTTWYAFANEEEFIPDLPLVDSNQGTMVDFNQGAVGSNKPIPDTKPDTRPLNPQTPLSPVSNHHHQRAQARSPAPKREADDDQWKKDLNNESELITTNCKGEITKTSISLIFTHFMRFEYTTLEIQGAIAKARQQGYIRDPITYLEAILKQQRTPQPKKYARNVIEHKGNYKHTGEPICIIRKPA